jgi:hypothetical protein
MNYNYELYILKNDCILLKIIKEMFPRFKYSDYEKFKDALLYLEKYLTTDVIQYIKLHIPTYIEKDSIKPHYFNIEERWNILESFDDKTLKQHYENLPENEKIVLFCEKNYNNSGLTPYQVIKNRSYMIESISRYENKQIISYDLKRTKSCSNILEKTNIYQEYKSIWEMDDICLSNSMIKFKTKGFEKPALYLWPDLIQHIDEKNKEFARNFIASIIRPEQKFIRRRLVHEV